ncbi:MAG: ArnT family glycosyltransferase [Nanobdellota archaeon]
MVVSKKMLLKHRSLIGCILIMLIVAVLLFTLAENSQVLYWDEPVYLANAQSHISDSHFTEDFRFPYLELVIAGVWSVTGQSVFVAKSVMILFSLLAIAAFYLIVREFSDQWWIHLLATGLFSLSSVFLTWGFRIYTDIPSLAFLLVSLFLLLRGFSSRSFSSFFFFLSGIFISFSFLFRFSTILTIIPFLAIFIIRKRYRSLLFLVIGSVVALLPWMIYNYIVYGNPLWDFLAQASAIASYTSFQSPLIFLQDMLAVFSIPGIVLLGIGVFGVVFSSWKKSSWRFLLLFSFVLNLLFYCFVVKLKLTRYILMILPLVVLLEVFGITRIRSLLNKFGVKRLLRSIVIACVVFVLIMFSFISTYTTIESLSNSITCQNDGAVKNSIDYIQETVPEGKRIVSNSWPWYGYYGNHQVSSFWMGADGLFGEDAVMINDSCSLVSFLEPEKIVLVLESGLPDQYERMKTYDGSAIHLDKVFVDDCNRKVVIYDVNKTLFNDFDCR